jgi:hypothetical protein
MTIQAIETRYAGCRFRSRLEARWAVFFDTLGVPWEYEPEGFDLDGLWYLPDFYLPDLDTWFEVKGRAGGADGEKFRRFSEPGDKRLVVDGSGHPLGEFNGGPDGSFDIVLAGCYDGHYAWCLCHLCGAAGVEFDGRGARVHAAGRIEPPDENGIYQMFRWSCSRGEHRYQDKMYSGDAPEILDAYTAARSARFEHGEAG